MPVKSHVSPDAFIFIPEAISQSSTSGQPPTILFFVTGNPGLIGYYHTFLSLLSTNTHCSPKGAGREENACTCACACVIAGFSLGGFEVGTTEDVPVTEALRHYSLGEQVMLTFERLRGLVEGLRADYGYGWTKPPRVILIGHSVGAYIALEVVRLSHRARLDSRLEIEMEKAPYKIVGAILLTPTIVDIAKSASGRVATPLLQHVGWFPALAQLLARGLSWVLSERVLMAVVSKVTGMKEGDALGTTVAFLRSLGGVRQALGMARDEMMEIRDDRWGVEVWGTDARGADDRRAQGEEFKAPRLVFYFAMRDHWVADETREEILKRKGDGLEGRWTRMVVEVEGKLVHGWCITQSAHVAEKVGGWVEEILRQTG